MPETLEKLRPDCDLQCYFEKPSAIAAFSAAGASGFTLSGSWRQQFDWAVVEWNRDNVYEHPLFRNLPDGDLSTLTLTYDETRANCIPIDSALYPTVDWPYLRIWAEDNGQEKFYRVRLMDHASPIEGVYQAAWAEFELSGLITAGDFIGISWPGEHHTYQLYGTDTLVSAIEAVAGSVNAFSPLIKAVANGTRIRLYYVGPGATIETSRTGHNGNRFGAYAYTAGAGTEVWNTTWQLFSNGTSPSKWRVVLNFSALTDVDGQIVPTHAVRKLRWTYAADFQNHAFERSESSVGVSNWCVSGANRAYSVAGPGSFRIENGDDRIQYSGNWTRGTGNFSSGSIQYSDCAGARVDCTYHAIRPHHLYLGSRLASNGAQITVKVDGVERTINLQRAGEDVLVRVPLGQMSTGEHSIQLAHTGPAASGFYFDFLECAVRSGNLPQMSPNTTLALATDWDTDHSLTLPPERTAWMIHSLGFHGRVNHYAGAMWFYELVRKNHVYASATVLFEGSPVPSESTSITIGRADRPSAEASVLTHLNHVGDTPETIARAFAIEINSGYTGIRAEADGNRLTIISRAMGADGNNVTIAVSPASGDFHLTASGPALSGGADGEWITDASANPRLNRATRDWTKAFLSALASYGIAAVVAFSLELQHGDSAPESGLAQRYPDGAAVLLNTPALQTNFSPVSIAYWREVYSAMADLMQSAGTQPYLQFGEVQWWYFPSDGSGMPFYDDYTRQQFRERFGKEIRVIPNNEADPTGFAEEVGFLPTLIGSFTDSIIAYVRTEHPLCRFEVLYPTDVNETPLNRAINFPSGSWTPALIECLKTESFSYTLGRNLNRSRDSVAFGHDLGFAGSRKSHLIGISDPATAWWKEARFAEGAGLDSVVLFALDQFCLVGYPWPPKRTKGASYRFG